MARYRETNSVIHKLFPKTMQVLIIKNLMAPHTNRKKIRKFLEKEFHSKLESLHFTLIDRNYQVLEKE